MDNFAACDGNGPTRKADGSAPAPARKIVARLATF
jgi:hypothetical protein